MRVVLDTNVLARATPGRNTAATEILDCVLVPPHLLIVSPYLLIELARVLRYERVRKIHGFDNDEIAAFVEHLQSAALLVMPPDPPTPVVPHDPDDDAVIAAAIAGQAEVLCTRDRHLSHPDVQAYCARYGIRILDDIELFRELRRQAPPAPGA